MCGLCWALNARGWGCYRGGWDGVTPCQFFPIMGGDVPYLNYRRRHGATCALFGLSA